MTFLILLFLFLELRSYSPFLLKIVSIYEKDLIIYRGHLLIAIILSNGPNSIQHWL